MKKTITIILILALLSVTIGFQSVASEKINYSCTVTPVMDFSIESVNGSFGMVQQNTNNWIKPTFVINNTESACELQMSIRFITKRDGIYGIVSDNSVISADKFNFSYVTPYIAGSTTYWRTQDCMVPNIDGSYKNLSIISKHSIGIHNVYMNASRYQEVGTYLGTIELMFEEHY